MNSKLTAIQIGICGALLLVGSAVAGEIRSRSVDDCYADLMRSGAPSSGEARMVRTRASDDALADLNRDWKAKPSGAQGAVAQTRTETDAYADLMRASFSIAVAK